jgi:cytochrome c oxidase assembly protein subunit 11
MSDSGDLRRNNRTLLVKLCVIVVAMFGFGYALVPFYDMICEATGLRNLAIADEIRNTQVDATRSVRIELDSNVRTLPWTFRPLEVIVSVHPGEVRQVVYEISNRTDRMTGRRSPVTVRDAAQYFRKLECFCFTSRCSNERRGRCRSCLSSIRRCRRTWRLRCRTRFRSRGHSEPGGRHESPGAGQSGVWP